MTTGKEITYDRKGFIINGKRVFIYSGEMQYFRIAPSQWYDRILKCKRAFLNCIGFYIPWNWHEKTEGKFNFEGNRDLEKWIRLIESLDLYIIARPGPYICSEWDFGGFPNWLIPKECELRSEEENFVNYTKRWLNKVNKIIIPHLITRDGKVILYQIENEFYFGALSYHRKLKEIVEKDGINVPIVTNENPFICGSDICGSEIIETIDLYPYFTGDILAGIQKIKNSLQRQPDKPSFVMETSTLMDPKFGEPLPMGPGYTPVEYDEVWTKGLIGAGICGLNFYTYHAGTNLGYWTGRNIITTYHSEAPIEEWGELTPRYYISRRLGGFLESFLSDLSEATPVKDVCKTTQENILVLTRRSKDNLFVFLGNLFSRDLQFKVLIHHPVTNQKLTIPYKGNYFLPSITMTIIPVNVKLTNLTTLVYTTSQVFYYVKNKNEKILIIYEKTGTCGETILELEESLDVSSQIEYRYEGKNLYLNYVHLPCPRVVTIGKDFKLFILNTETASHTWFFTYKEQTIPLFSNIYFLKNWQEQENKIKIKLQIKEGKNQIYIPLQIKEVKVNNKKIDFVFAEKLTQFDIPPESFPQIYYDLSGKWKKKEDFFEMRINYKEDASWIDWEVGTPLENYGFFSNGYCWYRTTFSLPEVRRPLYLKLSNFQDEISLFLNGEYIGSKNNRDGFVFKKDISSFLKKGENVLAILLESYGHDYSGYKSFNGISDPIYLTSEERTINLEYWMRKRDPLVYPKNKLEKGIPSEVLQSMNWEKIILSKRWDAPSYKNEDEECFLWYKGDVELPIGLQDKYICLSLGSVVETAYLFINGKFIGEKLSNPINRNLSFDITGMLKYGQRNSLVIGVKAGRRHKIFGVRGEVKITAYDYSLNKGWRIREGLSGHVEGWYKVEFDDKDWEEVEVLQKRSQQTKGIAWYRRKVEIKLPENYITPLRLTLKNTFSKALIYFNGVLIGRYTDIGPQEDFYIWEDFIRKENVIAIAVDGKENGVRLGEVSISPYCVVREVDLEVKI